MFNIETPYGYFNINGAYTGNTTRTLTGAPMDALKDYARETGDRFTKTWHATLDDRVRDEHAAMHGETVAIDKAFSNGLHAPGEPNCRCGLTWGVAE